MSQEISIINIFGTSLMLEVGFIHSKSHFLLELIEARGESWGGRGGVLKGVLKVKKYL